MFKEIGMKAQHIVLNLASGRKCRMNFDMGMLAHAECVYDDKFGRQTGINEIIAELAMAKARALMAVTYGAMMSAGEKITWDEFCSEIYTFENYQRLSDQVSDAVISMMRCEEDSQEGTEKNGYSRGAK